MSRECLQCCCYPCVRCCCHDDVTEKKTDRYPHIHYQAPSQANVAVGSPEFRKVPLDKVFEFRQPHAEHSVHPIVSGDSGVVSDQPRSRDMSTPPPLASSRRLKHSSETTETSESSHTGSSSSHGEGGVPSIQYSLYYDIQRNALTVSLDQAFNLPVRARKLTCDSLVVLYLLPNKVEVFESKVVVKDRHPIFNQVFEFGGLLGTAMTRQQTLIMRFFDPGRLTRKQLIGVASIPLEEADLYGVAIKAQINEKVDQWEVDSKGDLLFSITYKPATNVLQGIILKATNLQRQDLTGSADPYAKVFMFYQGKRQYKWKSSVKRNTLMPIFNETFQFDIFTMDISEISLEIVLMDYDRFSRDDIIGVIRVGATASEEVGRAHWEEVVSSPNHPVSRWHAITTLSSVEKTAAKSRTL